MCVYSSEWVCTDVLVQWMREDEVIAYWSMESIRARTQYAQELWWSASFTTHTQNHGVALFSSVLCLQCLDPNFWSDCYNCLKSDYWLSQSGDKDGWCSKLWFQSRSSWKTNFFSVMWWMHGCVWLQNMLMMIMSMFWNLHFKRFTWLFFTGNSFVCFLNEAAAVWESFVRQRRRRYILNHL